VLDVASHAGVSVGTVSNVLNYPEKVSPQLRERVLAAIEELAFVRNGAARQLRAGEVTTVGAILLDIRNPFFTELARGIEDTLAAVDFTLMLADSDDSPDREAKYIRLLAEQGVVGLLIVPSSPDLRTYVALQNRGVRVVLLDAPSPVEGLASVAVDDQAGGALAAAHLLGRGHREFVFLNGPHSIWQAAARRAGVDQAVRSAGLRPERAVREVTLDTLNAAGGDRAMEALMADASRPPAAIFCVNDLVAIGVQRALRRIGGSEMLESVDVVGYDDIEVSRELAVPLTSVRQPAYDMGVRGAQILLDPEAEAEHIVFQPELVVRASSNSRRA
jgi:LacI family transcriptional regulator